MLGGILQPCHDGALLVACRASKRARAAVVRAVTVVLRHDLRRLPTAMRAEHQQRVGAVVRDVVRSAHTAGAGMQIMGKQRRLEVWHAEPLAPRLAQVVARHECRAPVDRRATPKATAGEDRQGKIRGRHKAQPLKHLVEAERLRLRHFIGAHVHALFHDHDLEPTLSEVRSYDGATAAGADDHDISVHIHRRLRGRRRQLLIQEAVLVRRDRFLLIRLRRRLPIVRTAPRVSDRLGR